MTLYLNKNLTNYMTRIDLRKPHLCHVCKEKGMFYYKKWWCGHDKNLNGVCNNDQRKKATREK